MMKWLPTGVFAALLALSVTDVYALSCARPQVERSFNRWVDADETYQIGVGTLTALEPLPKVPGVGELSLGAEKVELKARYRFAGHMLGTGTTHPVDTTITVDVRCAGPWCANFPEDGTHGLMPLKITDGTEMTVTVGPCGGTIFAPEVEPIVAACMAAGRCVEPFNQ